MDRLLEKTKRALSDSGFAVEGEPVPDQAHFGNWILIATLGTVTVRITRDRSDIILDLIPRFLLREGASEDSWYTWDVVAKALNLKARTAEEMLELVSDDYLQHAFNHIAWKDYALAALRRTEEDKRRRFMEGLNVRAS
jgi:hypothetical protein